MRTRTLVTTLTVLAAALAIPACSSPSERYLPCELPPFGCPDLVPGPDEQGWETCVANAPLGVVVPIDDDDLPEP